jgi:hypothetical protein
MLGLIFPLTFSAPPAHHFPPFFAAQYFIFSLVLGFQQTFLVQALYDPFLAFCACCPPGPGKGLGATYWSAGRILATTVVRFC